MKLQKISKKAKKYLTTMGTSFTHRTKSLEMKKWDLNVNVSLALKIGRRYIYWKILTLYKTLFQYRKLSDKISVAENASPHVAAGSLERGRAANSLMQKMSLELRLAHFSRVISLSGDYKRTLDKIIAPPHRFFFNNYMIFFYSHWVKYGNRDLTE